MISAVAGPKGRSHSGRRRAIGQARCRGPKGQGGVRRRGRAGRKRDEHKRPKRSDKRKMPRSLVDELIKAEMGEVPGIVHEIGKIRRWTDPLLRQEDARCRRNRTRNYAWLWHSSRGSKQDRRVTGRPVAGQPREFVVVRDCPGDSQGQRGGIVVDRSFGRPPRTAKTISVRLCAGHLRSQRSAMESAERVRGRPAGDPRVFALVPWREALRPPNAN